MSKKYSQRIHELSGLNAAINEAYKPKNDGDIPQMKKDAIAKLEEVGEIFWRLEKTLDSNGHDGHAKMTPHANAVNKLMALVNKIKG